MRELSEKGEADYLAVSGATRFSSSRRLPKSSFRVSPPPHFEVDEDAAAEVSSLEARADVRLDAEDTMSVPAWWHIYIRSNVPGSPLPR